MKENSTAKRNRKTAEKREGRRIRRLAAEQRLTIGIDLGDRNSRYCILDEAGEVVREGVVATTPAGFSELLEGMVPCRVALEVGSHSPWVSRLVARMQHEVIVANPYKLKLITASVRKNDRVDAEQLARLARVDPKLLSPIHHRSEQAQGDLAVIRARSELMEARTKLVNAARGMAKPFGERLKTCDADQVGEALGKELSPAVQAAVGPLLKSIEKISEQIEAYDKKIAEMEKRYPEVELLTQVYGVGRLIGLAYVLTLEDARKFERSREVGPYLGLEPKQRDSGESQPQLGISKSGDQLLRSLLVQSAHCILREGAPDSDLRRWGRKKAEQGGKSGKRRAVVAVARKLSVLLHRLWANGEVYDPLYNSRAASKGARRVAGKGRRAAA
jgi:transposase